VLVDLRNVSVAQYGVFDEFQRDSSRGKSARK